MSRFAVILLPAFPLQAALRVGGNPSAPAALLSDAGAVALATGAAVALGVGPHPMAMVRAHLPDVCPAGVLRDLPEGAPVVLAGQVICRQRPGTARGVVFVSLEDETGIANAIPPPPSSSAAASSSPRSPGCASPAACPAARARPSSKPAASRAWSCPPSTLSPAPTRTISGRKHQSQSS